ncbi:hypothetical protein [Enterocloster citroniae]|uniref:hypothetical protein n=1 Tax=Enterocloster citroniae TaxID=358743 RepID=UPI003021D0A5|nr:hypothetical protein [Enterocloster citroniae]
MKKKADSKQVKANKVLRLSAIAASAESAIREPPPNTWSARMPPYTYTAACPDPGLRRPPMRVQLARLRLWYKRTFGGDADGEGEKAGHEAE